MSQESGTDWFGHLSPQVKGVLEQCMTRRSVAAGAVIFLEGDRGDSMFRIASGRVRIRSLSPGGKEVLLAVYGAGQFIGTVSLLDNLPRHNDAVAEVATELDVIRSPDFHRVAQHYPQVYRAVARSYATWIRDHHRMFVGGSSLEETLARRLDLLLELGGAQRTSAGAFRIDFTQEMLASSIAVSRQSISKLMQQWQQNGVVQYKHGTVLVLDRSRLRKLAALPTESPVI